MKPAFCVCLRASAQAWCTTLRCCGTSVRVETTAVTQSMLGGYRASGPDCRREAWGDSVRYVRHGTRSDRHNVHLMCPSEHGEVERQILLERNTAVSGVLTTLFVTCCTLSCSYRPFRVAKPRWRSCSRSTRSATCCSTAPTRSTDSNWIAASWPVWSVFSNLSQIMLLQKHF